MNQKYLMALLQEAANPNCHFHRKNKIQCELSAAICQRGAVDTAFDDGKREGLELVVSMLYNDALDNRPDLLPSLFPVFAILCGDRGPHMICSDVDWLLMR